MMNKEKYRLQRFAGKELPTAEHENAIMVGIYSDGANMTRTIVKGMSCIL